MRGRSGAASRSAIASFAASMPRWIQAGSVTPSGPNAAGGGGSNRARIDEQLERHDARSCSAGGSSPGRRGSRSRSARPRSRCARARSAAVIGEPAAAASAARLALAEVALVERIEAVVGEASRASPRGPAAGRARRAATAGRAAGTPRRSRRPGPERCGHGRRGPLDGVDEAVPGREPVASQLDGRRRGSRRATAARTRA